VTVTVAEQAAEMAQAALDRMRATGWRKHAIGPPGGPNCVIGAFMYETVGGNADKLLSRETGNSVAELFPDRFDPYNSLVWWNNHPDTTFEDIEQVLEKVIVRLREKVG
jgi:hypothetical protein